MMGLLMGPSFEMLFKKASLTFFSSGCNSIVSSFTKPGSGGGHLLNIRKSVSDISHFWFTRDLPLHKSKGLITKLIIIILLHHLHLHLCHFHCCHCRMFPEPTVQGSMSGRLARFQFLVLCFRTLDSGEWRSLSSLLRLQPIRIRYAKSRPISLHHLFLCFYLFAEKCQLDTIGDD